MQSPHDERLAPPRYDERGAPPSQPHWRAAAEESPARRGRAHVQCAVLRSSAARVASGSTSAPSRNAVRLAALLCVLGVRAAPAVSSLSACAALTHALAPCFPQRAAAVKQPQVLTPLLGVSREGTTVTFHSSQPATFTVLQDGGDSTYTTVERTTTSLTLRAGHAGGGKYTIRARLQTAACTAAPTSVTVGGHTCQFDAEWRVMYPWQAHLLSLLLLLLVSALVMGAIRIIRIRCCPQKVYDADDVYEGKRRVRSPSPVPDFALEHERAL